MRLLVLAALASGCWVFEPVPSLSPAGPIENDAAAEVGPDAPACEAAVAVDAGTELGCAVDRVFSKTVTIGRDGGDIALSGTDPNGVTFSLHIPPRALSNEVAFTVSEINEEPSQKLTLMSPVYVIEPLGVVFLKPVEIMLPMPALRSGSFGPGILSAYRAPNGLTAFREIADPYFNAGFFNLTISETGLLYSGSTSCTPGMVCR